MFTVKATYRNETRKFTFPNSLSFPTYDELFHQLYRVFPISHSYYLSKLLFQPDASKPAKILVRREVRNADEYEAGVAPFRSRSWSGALLRFSVFDDTPHKIRNEPAPARGATLASGDRPVSWAPNSINDLWGAAPQSHTDDGDVSDSQSEEKTPQMKRARPPMDVAERPFSWANDAFVGAPPPLPAPINGLYRFVPSFAHAPPLPPPPPPAAFSLALGASGESLYSAPPFPPPPPPPLPLQSFTETIGDFAPPPPPRNGLSLYPMAMDVDEMHRYRRSPPPIPSTRPRSPSPRGLVHGQGTPRQDTAVRRNNGDSSEGPWSPEMLRVEYPQLPRPYPQFNVFQGSGVNAGSRQHEEIYVSTRSPEPLPASLSYVYPNSGTCTPYIPTPGPYYQRRSPQGISSALPLPFPYSPGRRSTSPLAPSLVDSAQDNPWTSVRDGSPRSRSSTARAPSPVEQRPNIIPAADPALEHPCCSIAQARTEVRGLLSDFKLDLDRVLLPIFGGSVPFEAFGMPYAGPPGAPYIGEAHQPLPPPTQSLNEWWNGKKYWWCHSCAEEFDGPEYYTCVLCWWKLLCQKCGNSVDCEDKHSRHHGPQHYFVKRVFGEPYYQPFTPANEFSRSAHQRHPQSDAQPSEQLGSGEGVTDSSIARSTPRVHEQQAPALSTSSNVSVLGEDIPARDETSGGTLAFSPFDDTWVEGHGEVNPGTERASQRAHVHRRPSGPGGSTANGPVSSTGPRSSLPPDLVALHPNVSCDVCNMLPISGARHQCVDCAATREGGYDLCGTCFAAGNAASHNPFHEFREISADLYASNDTEREAFGELEARSGRHHRGGGRRHGRRGMGRRRGMRQAGNSESVGFVAACDLCDSRIAGNRYKCLDCPDWDACESCFAITPVQHPGHGFVKISDPDNLMIRKGRNDGPAHAASCNECKRRIVGTRYKCMHWACPDFDLCENCEALPIDVHPATHPMLKIKRPDIVIPSIARPSAPSPPVQTMEGDDVASVGYIRSVAASEAGSTRAPCTASCEAPELDSQYKLESFACHSPVNQHHEDSSGRGRLFVHDDYLPSLNVSDPPAASYDAVLLDSASVHNSLAAESESESINGYITSRSKNESDEVALQPTIVSQPIPEGNDIDSSLLVPPVMATGSDAHTPIEDTIPGHFTVTEERNTLTTPSSDIKAVPQRKSAASSRDSTVSSRTRFTLPPLGLDSQADIFRDVWPRLTQELHRLLQDARDDTATRNNPIQQPDLIIPGALDFTPSTQRRNEGVSTGVAEQDGGRSTFQTPALIDSPLTSQALLTRPLDCLEGSQTAQPEMTSALTLNRSLAALLNTLPGNGSSHRSSSPLTTSVSVVERHSSVSSVSDVTEPSQSLVLSAAFLADVTVPDGQVFPPGAEFIKCWRMVNDGQIDWPETTIVTYVGGDIFQREPASEGRLSTHVGGVRVGEEVNVWTGELKAPDVAGRYFGHWKLADGAGKCFGHIIWLDIIVAEPASISPTAAEERSLASSSVIMPRSAPSGSSLASEVPVPRDVAGSQASANPSTTLSNQSQLATDDGVSDNGSDGSSASLVSVPSSADDAVVVEHEDENDDDNELWESSRSHIVASAWARRRARTEYVVLYDTNSSEEEEL